MTDANTRSCPRCGAELDADAPDQPCAACLMKLGLESWSRRHDAGGSGTTQLTDQTFDPPTPEELSQRLPNLEVLELLGQGGMGAVYQARQKSLDRLVAVKLIRPDVAEEATFAQRFTREARALARLNHPNIVTIHDFGKTDGMYYLVMEFVEGTNLGHLIELRELAPNQALEIVPPICEALQYAHNAGIVHRDIKPANILIDVDGRVKIADFGLARLTGGDTAPGTLTGTRQVMGTPRYMAPEQMEGAHEVDHRADIYSLGVVIYEMLTGEIPLGHFEPPSKKVHVDVRLDEVVLRTLAREPERRYQQAVEVQTDVELISKSDATVGSRRRWGQRKVDSAAIDDVLQGNDAKNQARSSRRFVRTLEYAIVLGVLLGGWYLISLSDIVSRPIRIPEISITQAPLLLEQDSAFDSRDAEGMTPLMHAAINGQLTSMLTLLMHGADLRARDNRQRTPLMHAAEQGQTRAVELICDLHTLHFDKEVQARLQRLNRALFVDVDFASTRFDIGIDDQDIDGETALMKAARGGHVDAALMLLREPPKAHAAEGIQDNRGRTALTHAILAGQRDFLEAMVRDRRGRYSVHETSWVKMPTLMSVDLLLLQNLRGQNGLELLESNGFTDIADQLRETCREIIDRITENLLNDNTDFPWQLYRWRSSVWRLLGDTQRADDDLDDAERAEIESDRPRA